MTSLATPASKPTKAAAKTRAQLNAERIRKAQGPGKLYKNADTYIRALEKRLGIKFKK